MTRVITIAGNPDLEVTLSDRLLAEVDFEIFMRCLDRSEVLASLRAGHLDAIISVGAPHWLDRECIAEARTRSVSLVGIPSDPIEAESLERVGFVTGELATSASVESIRDVLAQRAGAPPPPPNMSPAPSGRTIAVWGPKGAPGRSRIATEVGWCLARHQPETLLVDGDPYGGDLRQMLGVVGDTPTTVWAAQRFSSDGAGADIWGRLCRVGARGPVLLPGLPRAELWAEVSDFGWRQLLEGAATAFRNVVIDVGFCLEGDADVITGMGDGRNRMARSAVAAASTVVAVAKADPIGLRNFMWAFDRAGETMDLERCVVVVNQVRAGHEAEISDLIRRHLGKKVAAFVPYAPNEIARALTDSRCVMESRPGSRFARSIEEVAATLGGPAPRRGLMSRLAGQR